MVKQIVAVTFGIVLIGIGSWLSPGSLAVVGGVALIGWGAFVADDGTER